MIATLQRRDSPTKQGCPAPRSRGTISGALCPPPTPPNPVELRYVFCSQTRRRTAASHTLISTVSSQPHLQSPVNTIVEYQHYIHVSSRRAGTRPRPGQSHPCSRLRMLSTHNTHRRRMQAPEPKLLHTHTLSLTHTHTIAITYAHIWAAHHGLPHPKHPDHGKAHASGGQRLTCGACKSPCGASSVVARG